MFKLVVLFALVAVAMATPKAEYLVSAPIVSHLGASAVSHQSRVDITSKPVIATAPIAYATAPVSYAAAPVAYAAAPVSYAAPVAYSYPAVVAAPHYGYNPRAYNIHPY